MTERRTFLLATCFPLFLLAEHAGAEPYIASFAHLRCSACHVNMTGGGQRRPPGSLPLQTENAPPALPKVAEEMAGFLSIGGDVRVANSTVVPPRYEGAISNEFRTEEANVYVTVRLSGDRLFVYVDERVAPGAASNREAFILYRATASHAWLKAGRFFPAYGTRLYDDDAYVRDTAGFSFRSADEGMEAGIEPGKYSLAASITNGAGGGRENDASKRVSLIASRLMGAFRIGLSASNNVTGGSRSSIGGAFGSVSWGDLAVLAEGDLRFDKDPDRSKRQWIGYLEAYWETTRGFTLRLSHEYLDPDRDVAADARTRSGFGFTWFPAAGLELSARVLYLDGPPQVAGQNSALFLAGAHLFF